MDFDIAIVGGGPAGLCFARSLAGTGLRIAILEQQDEAALADPPYDGREIALTHFSARLLRELGLWDRFAAGEVAPLRDAHVLNGPQGRAAMRIEPGRSGKAELGYLVSNHVIRRAAYESVRDLDDVRLLCATRVAGLRAESDAVQISIEDGNRLAARLVVAADSRYSSTRRTAGIPASMYDFGKTMVVCRMAHDRPHGQVACEWFDYGLTMALLPLNGNRTSVVLTAPETRARRLIAMPEAAFEREVEARLGGRLGALRLESARIPYPLVGVYAERFAAPRLALIGDAAVGMHPVTAHGFNFGLRGQWTLAREIRAALRAGEDIASPALLARYEREHREATRGLFLATQALVRLYTTDTPLARLLRDAGLRIGERLGPFKQALVETLTEEGERPGALLRAASRIAALAPLR